VSDHGLKCPLCGAPETRVIDTFKETDEVRRRRICRICGRRFITVEKIVTRIEDE
jgi:transcriptional repressor NrdR